MATTQTAPKKKGLINFDFLQKLGKVLMTVIAVMPAAGLMISLGKLVQMSGGDIAAVMTIGTTMENIGWAVINNLHILFAVAIGGSWAKERAGGAFAAVLAFALINVITGNIFGVTSAMLADPNAVTHTLFGQEIAVNGYFTSVLGAPALNMGVFVGIIAGFVGGVAYNKYYNFRKLPDALAFFNGKRFVPMVVIAYSVVISMVLALFWPVVQTGINNFGIWIANSSETSPVLAPFIYGTLERLLLPFGLHHMLTIPMNYTSFGGTYTIATGVNAGSQVFGQDPLWLAWANDLINFKKAGDMAAYNNLLATVAWQLGGKTTYALEGSVFVGGSVIQWLRDGLKLFSSSADSEPLAASVEDTGGVYLVPALTGLGAPYWDPYARGTIVGITRGTTSAHITRAALEAIAFEVDDVVRAMAADTGHTSTEMRVDGGAVANSLLMQFQADLTGVRIIRPSVMESTALGAAMFAGLAVGFWHSTDEICALLKPDRTFSPKAAPALMEQRRKRWHEAVRRSRHWVEE